MRLAGQNVHLLHSYLVYTEDKMKMETCIVLEENDEGNEYIENSGNYATFCPEFSNGQFQRTRVLINRVVHNSELEVAYLNSSASSLDSDDSSVLISESSLISSDSDLASGSNNSLVENTLTLDCSINAFSSDQIGILRDSAKAKYGSSLESSLCGDILAASCKNSLYSDSGNCLICLSNNLNRYKNSNSSMAENFFILSLSDNSSSNTYFGEKSLQSCFNSSLNTFLLVESILKNENSVLASGINSLGNSIFDYRPCRLATLFFNSSASCLTCFSVNFDLDSIASAIANSTSITRFLNALSSAVLNSSLNSAGTSNLIVSSAILDGKDDYYIKISGSGNYVYGLVNFFGNYIGDKMKMETCIVLEEKNCGNEYEICYLTLELGATGVISKLSSYNVIRLPSNSLGFFGCGAIDSASDKNCENSSAGMGVIISDSISYTSLNSFSDNLVSSRAFDLCFLISSNKNSGAINLNLFNIAFNKTAINEVPLFISNEIATLASIINLSDIIYFENDSLYLLASEMLISSANSFADFSVNLDFDTICFNLTSFDSLSFSNLARSMDKSILGIVFNSDSNSSGMDIVNSAMGSRSDVNYINLSANSNSDNKYFDNLCIDDRIIKKVYLGLREKDDWNKRRRRESEA